MKKCCNAGDFILKYEDLYKHKLLEKILDYCKDGINVVNSDGILVYSNKISADYANSNRSDMIGKHIAAFYPQAAVLKVLKNKNALLDKKIHYVGKKKYVISSYPIYIDNEFQGAFSVFQDIQEIEELNNRIKSLELHLTLSRPEDNISSVIGNTGSLQNVLVRAKRTVGSLAGPRHSIIIGESGTGKTMLANLIYKYAIDVGVLDKKAPFIEINCGQFTNPDIAAVEIFGSEEGAYTGSKQKKGLFEQANGGILFLDEAHALEKYQTLLLKAIESGRIRRIGCSRDIAVDVIIIAASTKNLKEEMLPELYQRLAQYELYIPSLMERSFEEKRSLFNHFVDKYIRAVENLHGINFNLSFNKDAEEAILSANYPRNIRQLRDVINYSIDASTPLISDIKGKDTIYVIVDKEHLPFEPDDQSVTTKAKHEKKINLDKRAEIIIKDYHNLGYGPRRIAQKMLNEGYEIEYYRIAYYLRKLKSQF
ncbi:sigma 54-interacting transcriptional regulator [Sporomusa sp. KB1]|uniref:sigma 54-interacting transcriptional regulator n=1 Tax=Sporomusa sp. KB1 TaxID=943346 RepID=UPI0011A3C774|nr:sigma 54-interacting transcriptional regulator [Sporomusa sp. KB1]TWH51897.1 arginine utilization regulatory protein [Sporomusa sp. KB1]